MAHSTQHSDPPSGFAWSSLWSTPWLWSVALTVGFYSALPHLPAGREQAERYFCGHPVSYLQAGLFFLALCDLAGKGWRLRRDRKALAGLPLSSLMPTGADRSTFARDTLLARCHGLSRGLQATAWGRRLRDLALLASGSSAERMDENVAELASVEEDRFHDSYSLLNTVIWAIPITGFLGTVLGITIAIAHITPEQLDRSLGEVTGGLAVAFDTTAVALVQSLFLVFCQWSVKAGGGRVLADVDAMSRVLARSLASGGPASPLEEAQSLAAQALVDRTEVLLDQQTRAWNTSVEQLRERWANTLEAHRDQLSQSLTDGAADTWADHRDSLAAARTEFVDAYREVSRQLADSLAQSEAARQRHEELLSSQSQAFWASFDARWRAEQSARDTAQEAWSRDIAERLAAWQTEMRTLVETAGAQMQVLQDQTRLLGRVVEQEEQLVGVQQRLTANLEAVRAAEAFEQTLHSLNAAVHLLTARHAARAA
ncbi:MAG: MotA/TolQ/ExbB proton channel family protein [Planctomyces sp.]|nr:MotA/TolQ/ExbB proton channel family protein [Planctomyces sp.]